MKILLTGLSGQFGGMEIHMIQEAVFLKGLGHDVEIGINRFPENEKFFSAAAREGIYCFNFDVPPFFENWKYRRLNLIKAYLFSVPKLKKSKFDLAHVFMPWTNQSISQLWVCTMADIPCLLSIRGNFSNKAIFPKFHKIILNFVFRKIHGIYALTTSAKDFFLRNFDEFIPKTNFIQIIPNTINFDRFKKNQINREAIRKNLNIPESFFVVGYIGRLTRRKNPDKIIRAFHKFIETNNNCILLIIGDGPQADELKTIVKELNIVDSVRMLGFCDDVAPYFQACDVTMLLSEEEGFGSTILESLGCQVPVICSDVPGPRDMLLNSAAGFLIDKNKTEETAKILTYIKSNPEKADLMGEAGRKLALEKYGQKVFFENLSKFYGIS